MSDYNKSMDVQLTCNQRVVNYNKLRVMNPMGFNGHWPNYLEIIDLHTLKKCKVRNQRNLVPLGTTLLR